MASSASTSSIVLLIAWTLPGTARAEAITFTNRLVSISAPNADGIAPGDVDGDGDVDIVTGEYSIQSIAW